MLLEWTHRFGPGAAAHRIAFLRLRLYIRLLTVVIFVLTVVAMVAQIVVLVIVAGVVLLVCAVLSVRSVIEFRRTNDAILHSLKIDGFGSYATPFDGSDEYRTWCEKMGLEPYPFRDAEPPVIRVRWF